MNYWGVQSANFEVYHQTGQWPMSGQKIRYRNIPRG